MKQDVIFSISLHLLILLAVMITAPFSISKNPFDQSQVIKIRAISMPELEEMMAVSLDPVVTPEAVIEDEPLEIPIDDPTTIDKPKAVDKPVEKPKETKKTENTKVADTKDNEAAKSSGKEIETSSTTGSPFAGATVDDANFDYPYWFDQAFNKIVSNFKRTVSIDGNVVCVLRFKVIRSGRLVNVEVTQTSGYSSIDSDCIGAVKRSAPFPPLPREFRSEIIEITLPVKY